MLFATDGEIPESVMMTSTWSSVQIFPNPLFPNLEESARTIVRSEAAIIRWLSRASSMFEVVSPKSRSIPSTPINSLEQVRLSNACAAKSPMTEKELLRNVPPSLYHMNVLETVEQSRDIERSRDDCQV